eukprot:CAMPEP_0119494206 /NCGR_PEP_ID=MMETSP1344-20130328/18230_1 /TAXON_ID=236787 /ORGANISM="Florenciella parvula, Strain CCMP2471" /LENGTH=41 /DNA_ID= /DNA_START= /DNA_END= /DNA_ORIENTATION=
MAEETKTPVSTGYHWTLASANVCPTPRPPGVQFADGWLALA